MAELPETKVRFSKDLMRKVMHSCAHTNHSAKAFIEECVKACLMMIETKSEAVPVPTLVEMARRKQGKDTWMMDASRVKSMIEQALSAPNGGFCPFLRNGTKKSPKMSG